MVYFAFYFWWGRGETAAAHPACSTTASNRLQYPSHNNFAKNDYQSFFTLVAHFEFNSPLKRKDKEHTLRYTLYLFNWWSRGELNSCPKTYSHRHLRAQSLIKNSLRRKASDSPNGFGSFIGHARGKAYPCHVHHCVTPLSEPWSSR